MKNILIAEAKDTHDKLREILIKYNSPEYGDCIVDEICWLFGNYPNTIDVEPEEPTNVEFYVATYEANELDEQPYKEVIAVFTDTKNSFNNETYFECYAHLGQHSNCSLSFLRENCKKATKEEYQELFNELNNSVGYNLEIV